jgi:pimeloyl-ACP methyl ester carboxylesterase
MVHPVRGTIGPNIWQMKTSRQRPISLKIPVTVIQGGKDGLVLPANADFAERMLKNKKPKIIRVTDAGHFILWKKPDIIRDAILGLLDQNCQAIKINQGLID